MKMVFEAIAVACVRNPRTRNQARKKTATTNATELEIIINAQTHAWQLQRPFDNIA